jgi:O-antigen ligase
MISAKPNFLWKYFPTLYVIPFLMAAINNSQVATIGAGLRWLVLLVGCWVAAHVGFRRATISYSLFSRTDKIIVGFLLIFFLSETWTIQPWLSAQRAVSMMLLYGCSFWALWQYADQFSEKQLVRQILQILGLALFLNLLAIVVTPEDAWLVGRFRGFFVNPNNLGLVLSLAIPLTISQWVCTRQQLFLVLATVFIITLAICASRSPLLGISVSAVAMLISLFAKRAFQVIAISSLSGAGLAYFIQTDFFSTNILREGSLATASNRTYFWTLAKNYISHRPDFGHGFGTDSVIHDYYSIVLSDLNLRGYGVMSSYYGLAVQLGWPLTFFFFGLLWGLIGYYFLKYWHNYELTSLVSVLASGLVVCVFEPAIYSAGNTFSFLFWLILMLVTRRRLYERKKISAFI